MSPDARVRTTSVVFPLLLIGFGGLLLLWRWLPDFDPWPVVGRYWPLLLILLGAGLVWDHAERRRAPEESPPAFPVGTTLGTILFLLLIAFLLWRSGAFLPHNWMHASTGTNRHGHQTEVVDRKDAKAVRMEVQLPAGQLRITGGADRLLEADFNQSGGWPKPEVDYRVDQGIGALRINQPSGGQFVGSSDNTWNLKVSNEVPLELKIDLGAGRSDLDLARVDLSDLKMNIGAGQAFVDLTGERAKDLRVEIHGGVGEAVVRLPKSIGVVATVHGGLGSIELHGLKEEDGRYVNSAYGKAPNTLHMSVEGGIGHIKLEEE